MPNLPKDFVSTDWDICTRKDPRLADTTTLYWVRHIPTGTTSRSIAITDAAMGKEISVGIFKQQINRLISETWKDVPYSFKNPDVDPPPKRDPRTGNFTSDFDQGITPDALRKIEQYFKDNPESRPLMTLGAPKKYTRNKNSRPDPGTFYLDITGKEFVWDGSQWLLLSVNTPKPNLTEYRFEPETNGKAPTNNTAASHGKRKFNFD